MKALLLIFFSIATAAAMHGQAYFDFGNLNSSGIALNSSFPGEGNVGNFLGSEYSASLYYEAGTHSGLVDPTTLTSLSSMSAVSFFGTTGAPQNLHGPHGDGAGLFDGGFGAIPGTIDGEMISVEVAIWYAGPGATSYSTALALGYNAGYSSLVPVRLIHGIADVSFQDVSAVNSYTSGFAPGLNPIPEPATMALWGLGGAALWLFRRRK